MADPTIGDLPGGIAKPPAYEASQDHRAVGAEPGAGTIAQSPAGRLLAGPPLQRGVAEPAAGARSRRPRRPGVWAVFWAGIAAIVAGVGLHIQEFMTGHDARYQMAGMPMDPHMYLAMALIVAGLGIDVWALLRASKGGEVRRARTRVSAAPTRPAIARTRLVTLVVLASAVSIDAMKPFTFSFVLPGAAKEYGLTTPVHVVPGSWPVSLYPLAGIAGTFLGALIWGKLADHIGRRHSILLAAILFIATSICGAMPSFGWNLVMCLIMGLGAGGLLPCAYALIVELVPEKSRGTATILVAGAGTAVGFLLTSICASLIIPKYGWRPMWFVSLPTGLFLIALNRYLPESPRYLAARGRHDEAAVVARRYGLSGEPRVAQAATAPAPAAAASVMPTVVALLLCGLGWGFINFGLITWIPTFLTSAGASAGGVTHTITNASLLAAPMSVVTAYAYRRSSWATVAGCATAVAILLGLLGVDSKLATDSGHFTIFLFLLFSGLWGLLGALTPYCAELFATTRRGTASGWVSAATKLGGVVALVMAATSIQPPGMAGAAVLGACPLLVGALLLLFRPVETSGRPLPDEATFAEAVAHLA